MHGSRSGRDACVMAEGGARMDGHQSRPPHHKLSLPLSTSVDSAAWVGSGHHQETHMWGTEGLPSPHATNCHAVAYEPTRRRTTCACHTRDQTHTHQWGERGSGVGSGGDGGENMQRAASATSTWANRESAPERADGAAKCELAQALVHGRRGPHAWALGDCCKLGRCPSTHTPHTTPHPRTHWGNT